MAPDREWLTDGEIRAIVHEEMRDELRKQTVLLDKIADGAQAQLISANLMHGNPEMGLRGFIPEVLERLAGLERGAQADRLLDEKRDADLEEVKANQGKLLKFSRDVCRAFFMKEGGTLDWKRIGGLFGATGLGAHVLLWPHQTMGILRGIWDWVGKGK